MTMRISNLRASTAARLAVIDHYASVRAAALALSRPGIGLAVACSASGRAEGVVSKSDLVRHLADPAPSAPPVAALMSRRIVFCRPGDDLHAVWQLMAARGLQNIPVFDADSRPVGILDVRDAMQALFDQEQTQERMLINYVGGFGYR